MALSYGFYNGINHDRTYNAEQISALFDGLIHDGVFDSIGDIFATVPGDGLQVLVKSGKAWFDHTWTINDAPIPLTIATPDVTLARIDAVVLEVNHAQSVRANSIKIKTGTAATTPTKPAMTMTEDIHQYALAYVTVPAAATEIKAANIEINVGKSSCPFVTGIIQSANIDDLFNQWEGQFDAWFANLQAQLTDDVVANLQRQIDLKLNIADKATDAEATAGTNNTHYMTPSLVKKSVEGKISNGDDFFYIKERVAKPRNEYLGLIKMVYSGRSLINYYDGFSENAYNYIHTKNYIVTSESSTVIKFRGRTKNAAWSTITLSSSDSISTTFGVDYDNDILYSTRNNTRNIAKINLKTKTVENVLTTIISSAGWVPSGQLIYADGILYGMSGSYSRMTSINVNTKQVTEHSYSNGSSGVFSIVCGNSKLGLALYIDGLCKLIPGTTDPVRIRNIGTGYCCAGAYVKSINKFVVLFRKTTAQENIIVWILNGDTGNFEKQLSISPPDTGGGSYGTMAVFGDGSFCVVTTTPVSVIVGKIGPTSILSQKTYIIQGRGITDLDRDWFYKLMYIGIDGTPHVLKTDTLELYKIRIRDNFDPETTTKYEIFVKLTSPDAIELICAGSTDSYSDTARSFDIYLSGNNSKAQAYVNG